MLINPHNTCAQVLETLRSSGLTYTLNETPYSVYVTIRKKFTKEFSSTNHVVKPQHAKENQSYEDILAKLVDEISSHNLTKHELSQREEELKRLVEGKNANIDTISKLKDELAQEVDEHAQAEQALRKLEEKVKALIRDVEIRNMENEAIDAEKESLRTNLTEQLTRESNNHTKTIRSLTKLEARYKTKSEELFKTKKENESLALRLEQKIFSPSSISPSLISMSVCAASPSSCTPTPSTGSLSSSTYAISTGTQSLCTQPVAGAGSSFIDSRKSADLAGFLPTNSTLQNVNQVEHDTAIPDTNNQVTALPVTPSFSSSLFHLGRPDNPQVGIGTNNSLVSNYTSVSKYALDQINIIDKSIPTNKIISYLEAQDNIGFFRS